jgi:hypothetical protein
MGDILTSLTNNSVIVKMGAAVMRNIWEVISQHGRGWGQSKSSPSARALNSQAPNQPHQQRSFVAFLHAERNDKAHHSFGRYFCSYACS